MAIERRKALRIPSGPISRVVAAFAVLAAIGALTAASAGAAVVYNNVDNPLPGNLTSEAFEATQTTEFGGQVQLVGALNPVTSVQVIMSSWGCESGTPSPSDGSTPTEPLCTTTPGATFSEPITLTFYSVGADNAVGSPIGSVTQTFDIPYRPSESATPCDDASSPLVDYGGWFDSTDDSCYHGLATPITFDLAASGITLPNDVILGISYNTSDYGSPAFGDATTCHSAGPGGSDQCGYDSLNVALTQGGDVNFDTPPGTPEETPPSIGSDPDPGDAYAASTWGGAYCDSGAAGLGAFRLDSDPSCWLGWQPEFEISGVTASTTTVLTASSSSISGAPVSFTATVNGPAGATPAPTGTVTFSDGGTQLGTAALSASGDSASATFTTSSLGVGAHSITASYVGDSNYAASASSTGAAVTVTAPAPPPAGVASATFGTPTSGLTVAGSPLTVNSSSSGSSSSSLVPAGGASASVTVPAGALPAGTTVSVYPVVNAASLSKQVPAGDSYLVSFAVSWSAPGGGSPDASSAISMTITDPSIKAGDTIYAVTSKGLTAVGTATENGTATITFTSDPTFIVTKALALTGKHISLKRDQSASIIGSDTKAKVGAKVTVRLLRGGTVVRRTTVKLASNHRFLWNSGKLSGGSYSVRFLVSGKVVKTTTIRVA